MTARIGKYVNNRIFAQKQKQNTENLRTPLVEAHHLKNYLLTAVSGGLKVPFDSERRKKRRRCYET